MVFARKYVVVKSFDGYPKRSDFEIVQEELPPLKDGEYLVKADFISVDPYQRAYLLQPPPYDQFGLQVGTVLESKNANFPVGSHVVSHSGWRDHTILDENFSVFGQVPYVLPDLKGLPISLGVGAVGMPGATAYLSFLDICKPHAGETVVVSGAAGAVGSIVGQIAKMKGCRVIGLTGTDAKAEWLKTIGYDVAINYKKVDLAVAIKEAAPNGVDCYYDNVGGEISSTVIYQMNKGGRVAVVGSISCYNEKPGNLPKATILQLAIVSKSLKVEGFIIWDHYTEQFEAFKQLTEWISGGQIEAREHVTEGFDNIVDAFVGVLRGDNYGKGVVKI